MTDDDFDRSMSDTDWATVYERQTEREDLVPHLCRLLDLSAGDRVLDIGCGPGYTATRLADRVAPGPVYALDRHLDALRYLLEEADGDVEHIRPVVGDVEALPVRFSRPIAAVASLVLHHVDAPERAIEAVAAAIPGTRSCSSSSTTRTHRTDRRKHTGSPPAACASGSPGRGSRSPKSATSLGGCTPWSDGDSGRMLMVPLPHRSTPYRPSLRQ